MPSRQALSVVNTRVVAVSVVINLVTSVGTAPPTRGRYHATRSPRFVQSSIALR
ncbi:hypothetical protein PF005_g7787 [Phytophthora fragariae]|uniref:Uncharacterized protein n=1 Tax=Phytophthora fragariae TaxID=53985 RepID=A0A6A3U9V6_9STRA|nr:hypothetical protein PF003_g1739 [Phytophthora fragariae]KAE8941744.1 hypothetical protein PF009_g8472 [Phytophthora fragariae]KAE9123010.1 hypothetical protein PF007_g7217 [Phytophthora fragariae]KAE9147711.1 hypothetical protein PF006_g7626 [Phytophthora fragariae]KAE9219640.1 hypothetical protein PF005_g7787 [Phytophthora fragariae]